MKKSYDSKSAKSLIPLLQVLNREISERTESVQRAAQRVHGLRRDRSRIGARQRRDEIASLQAQIATHKREIRNTERELARLGCLVDANNPTLFHIPGRSGDVEDGFLWHVGASRIEIVSRD
jgi:predicted RNase H-like nuclease (RuvC/YqgF family)